MKMVKGKRDYEMVRALRDRRDELEERLALLQARDDLISKAFLSYRESVLAATAELANIFKPIKPESEDDK
jgi:hypothetical protein